jgi:hypothetical protein
MSHGECWVGINLSVPTTFLPHPVSVAEKKKKKRAHDEIAESKEKKQQERKRRG